MIPPVSDHLPIALRAYATKPRIALKEPGKGKRRAAVAAASEWTLVFDTETTTDAGQALRFGTYQLRKGDALEEEGLFYDTEGVTDAERATLRGYADAHGLALLTREQFVDEIFYARGYALRAAIVGFNLPFDLSRLAIRHGTARAPLDGEQGMRDAFTFRLSEQKIWPNVRVKHMSRTAAQISFAAPMRQPDGRGQRRRGDVTGVRRGHFVDVKTLANALFARSFTLGSLSAFLNVDNGKLAFDDFAGPITAEMIRYAARDTQATWECYAELLARFGRLGLSRTKPEKAYSSASIGKGYLREMGIKPWRDCQPTFPGRLTANIMASYFGGRSEVRIRRELRQVMLCDFLSMYPTVCTLMGLWRFVIADGITWIDVTAETRQFLARVDLSALRLQPTWRELTTLVRVAPSADIFPVRACYSGEAQATIGLNHLTADQPLWFTLADCVASKLLTGKTCEIVQAIRFAPGPVQPGLRIANLAGNADYRIDPATDDMFRRLIELRHSVKQRMAGTSGEERDRLDTEQNSLKITANSTSYGIYAEVNVDRRSAEQDVLVLSSTAHAFRFATDKPEIPGSYFHPLLATLITGAARLMLAITERHIVDAGLEWAFCDTDSMAIAKPDALDPATFADRVQAIIGWFDALNPYAFGGPILKSEEVNRALDHTTPEPLYCWAISAKRYALFNVAPDGRPILRKVSAHGLGHLIAPYGETDAPASLPAPHPSVLRDGTQRWHADFWHQIVTAALNGTPDRVKRDWHWTLRQPAAARYSASTPELLSWFAKHNQSRPCRERVRPFNFLLAATAERVQPETIVGTGRKRKSPRRPKPVAPYDKDHGKALAQAFDRNTGEPIPPERLVSYAEALRQYHLHPEAKFLNGDYLDQGMTQRRHVRMTFARHIGKESNDWERQAALGLSADAQPDYGLDDAERARLLAELGKLVAREGAPDVARALGMSATRLRSLSLPRISHGLAERLPDVSRQFDEARDRGEAQLDSWRKAIAREGLRSFARRMGLDPSNLCRKLKRASS
jgi:hypothetical protein